MPEANAANEADRATGSNAAVDRLWAVVPAGGAGTRLWPLSRAGHPKFLLDLTGAGRTLLQQTVDRVEPLVGERCLVVTGARHADAVRRQLPQLSADAILAEPSPRDSMAAIGLAAAILERRDPAALLVSLAADHVIVDAEGLRACLAEAAEVAATGAVVTIGIEPTHASTAFGYIEVGDPLPGFASARSVTAFVEKPDQAVAEGYLASGRFRWNGGMFVVGATVLLDTLADELPDLAAGLRAIAAEPERLDELWPRLTKIAIDHAVAEPAAAKGRVAVVPGRFGWDDIGDFASLRDVLTNPQADAKADPASGALTVLGDDGRVVAHDASGLVVAGERTIAVLGLDDVVVVDTGDALLVTTRARAQDVKAIVATLKERGHDDLV